MFEPVKPGKKNRFLSKKRKTTKTEQKKKKKHSNFDGQNSGF